VTPIPLVFHDVLPMPLAIGADQLVREALGWSRAAVKYVLHYWCTRLPYIDALAAGGPRYDLQGHPVEAIDPEHQASAQVRAEAARAASRHSRKLQKIGMKVQSAEVAVAAGLPV
jgi:sRNA-binding protein